MSNDGATHLRVGALEKQVSEQSAVIAEMKAEHAAAVSILAEVQRRLTAQEIALQEFRCECLERFAHIESALKALQEQMATQMATKEDVARALNRGLLTMFMIQCALNGALYALLK